jgi:uncharacterized membrane protein YvbJ
MNCPSCKNPVTNNSNACEWCGVALTNGASNTNIGNNSNNNQHKATGAANNTKRNVIIAVVVFIIVLILLMGEQS